MTTPRHQANDPDLRPGRSSIATVGADDTTSSPQRDDRVTTEAVGTAQETSARLSHEGTGGASRWSSVAVTLRRVWRLEFAELFRWHRVASLVVSLLPSNAFHGTRTRLLRLFGWQLGRGVVFSATPRLLGAGAVHRRLVVGDGVYVNVDATWELGEQIRIGDNVHIGQGVSLLTTSHRVGGRHCRAGALTRAPIDIGAGSWIAAGATVHAGITVGEGAIVAAGCVVTHDVPANCFFGGVPGRVIRTLD